MMRFCHAATRNPSLALLAAILTGSLSLSGCSLKLIALRQTASLIEGGVGTFYEESDVQLAQESLGSQLKLVEALLKNDPLEPRLNLVASQGFGAYAFLFLEGSQDDRARAWYLRGRDHGLRVLRTKPAFKSILSMDLQQTEAALTSLGKKDVPILFWTAYCWAGWVNLSRDNAEAVADLPKAVALMARARELDAAYQYGGADLFLGAYFASRPKLLGGDPEKAKLHFARAKELTQGRYLLAYLLEARYYAVAVQDPELFRGLLDQVKTLPAGSLPEARLADEVSKRKAAALMEKTDELF
ncbi:MAG: hypothetical protein HY927_04025 [Elusimicrobia bacterium]|nr:hypothetical protein [Elusimicrobiota bacterium]